MLFVPLCLFLASTNGLTDSSKAPPVHLPAIDGEVDPAQLEAKVVYLDFRAS